MLNARRHRSGEIYAHGSQGRAGLRWFHVLNARRHRSGEITMKRAARQRLAVRPVLNARRHRSGESLVRAGPSARARGSRSACSTPEGIGAARSRYTPRAPLLAIFINVLNARRHRSGEITILADSSLSELACMCSTPEGIGAARSQWRMTGGYQPPRTSAQRPKASERRVILTGHSHALATECCRGVLNARRHRSGEITACCPIDAAGVPPAVLNARRHRSGGQIAGGSTMG